jgi:hypothetical protein
MKFARCTAVFAALCFAYPVSVSAGDTKIWELAGYLELQKGELKGTSLSSFGEVSLGLIAEKEQLDEKVGVVWSAAKNRNLDVFLGTGYDGRIYRVQNRAAILIAETKQLVVTALAFDKNGDLYAASLPDPIIWKIKNPGAIKQGKPIEAEKWATLPEKAKHIWSLTFSKDKNTLYAGTGPDGVIFAVGQDKAPKVYLDTEEEHIMSTAIDEKGNLLAGTSPSAMLLKVTGPGRSIAIVDFEGNEVKAIVPYGDDIFVAVNDFKSPPEIPSKTTSGVTAASEAAKALISGKSTKAVVGDGSLFRIDFESRAEKLWSEKKQHVTSMAVAKNKTVFLGLGADGKVVSVDDKRHIRNELDLDERQVTAVMADSDLTMVACGDQGALYAVLRGRKAEAVYLTPLLDASTLSEWGHLTWYAAGRLKVESRSGNTVTPDNLWSDWSKPIAQGTIPPSPKARYLQLRFSWAEDEKAVLTSLQLAMKPLNLRATILEFDPGSPFPKPEGSVDETTSDRMVSAAGEPKTDTEVEFAWKVDNPDGDTLRYKLWYRGLNETLWRPILREDQVLTSFRYSWKTEAVQEGTYQIKLEADDSLDNDSREVLEDTFISPPVLIDNHQPEVKGLVVKNGVISGFAEDSFSPIGAINFSVDNGPWNPVSPDDRVFDEKKETFSSPLPKELKSGPHDIAVRALDRVGNMGVAELHIIVK